MDRCQKALMLVAEIAIILVCLPCLCTSRLLNRRRKRYRHTVLIVAPTRKTHVVINEFSDGSWSHLLIPGNRIFCMKRGSTGLLVSGNVASAPGIELEGDAQLVATVPRDKWRDMLGQFKGEREKVVARKMINWRGGCLQKEWVQRCSDVLRQTYEATEEGDETFQVWQVDCSTFENEVVEEVIFDTEVARVRFSNNDKCMWSTRLFIPPGVGWVGGGASFNSVGQQVEDLFEGEWTSEYIDGKTNGQHGQPMRINYRGDWIQSFGPRRSMDSGVLEKAAREDIVM